MPNKALSPAPKNDSDPQYSLQDKEQCVLRTGKPTPLCEPLTLTPNCVSQMKILADSTRFAVLELLLRGPQPVHAMNDVLGVEQSLLSHHLKTLRESGFVVSERNGKVVQYRLATRVKVATGNALNLGCCILAFDTNDTH